MYTKRTRIFRARMRSRNSARMNKSLLLRKSCSVHLANIYTCTRPHPLYHARTPAPRDSASGRYVDDTILAGVVSKNHKIWMTELCRLGSSVGRALVRITRDPLFESRLSSTLFCHIHMTMFEIVVYCNVDNCVQLLV